MPDPLKKETSADEPVTDVDQETPPTPHGRADDDTDVRDDDGDTDIGGTEG